MSWRSVLRTWELVFRFGDCSGARGPWRSAEILKKARFEMPWNFLTVNTSRHLWWLTVKNNWPFLTADGEPHWDLRIHVHACGERWSKPRVAIIKGVIRGPFHLGKISGWKFQKYSGSNGKSLQPYIEPRLQSIACTVRPSPRPWRLCLINSLAMFWKFLFWLICHYKILPFV